jgi:hypothetical protein
MGYLTFEETHFSVRDVKQGSISLATLPSPEELLKHEASSTAWSTFTTSNTYSKCFPQTASTSTY